MSNKYYGNGKFLKNRDISQEDRRCSIDEMKHDSLDKWYATYYDAEFCMNCDGPEYLKNFYLSRKRYAQRFNSWFNKLNLDGNVHLDIGFASGKTIYWLAQRYPNIVIDTFDFNENCKNLFEPLKELVPQIRNITIDDASNLNYENESYDSITAIDFYEHTPRDIMIKSLEINYKILKYGGEMHLYVGKSVQPEHINLIPDQETIELCEGMGFKLKRVHEELLTFEK